MEFGTLETLLGWVVMFSLLWVGILGISVLMLRRAISQVINSFREGHSFCPQNPKSAEELGLAPSRFADRPRILRDYRPYALDLLIKTGAIRVTEEGKLCLLESGLKIS